MGQSGKRAPPHSFARVTDSNATLAGDDGPHSDSASSAGGARSPCIRRIGSELSLGWGSNGDRPAPRDERRRRFRARQHVHQRVLDRQAARRAQPPRDLVPRVLQAAAAALLHRAADTAGRRRLRPFHGARNDAGRSRVDGPPPVRLRRQSAERRACASRGCSLRRLRRFSGLSTAVDFDDAGEMPEELLVFYHPDTLRQISALRKHLLERERSRNVDRRRSLDTDGGGKPADRALAWILLGLHAAAEPGGLGPRAGARSTRDSIRARPLRDVPSIILSKSRSLLRDVTAGAAQRLAGVADSARIVVGASSIRRRSTTTPSRWPSRLRRFSTWWTTRATTGCDAGSAASTRPPCP